MLAHTFYIDKRGSRSTHYRLGEEVVDEPPHSAQSRCFT